MSSEEAFIQIIKDHEAMIYKISSMYGEDKEDRKDLYQDIVFQLWKSLSAFRNQSKLSTWMYRVALNTAITHSKVNSRNKKKLNELVDQIDDQDSILEERTRVLYQEISKLNVIERAVVLLHLEGKNYEEISTITGMTTSNVGTRLTRIKQKLKSQITIN